MKNIQGLALEFYLNDKLVRTTVTPDLTALRLIREQLGLTGAKEVCAEGDCGACTIALGSWQDDKFVYQAINSCILPVARLHGCHVITVEGLAVDNKLNIIQEMMLEHHAVQCGYCTAGMIMAMFCLFINKKNVNQQDILVALEGNLCRCTGYKAIYDAAKAVRDTAIDDESEFIKSLLPAYAIAVQQKIKNIGILKPVMCNGTVADKLEAYYIPKTLTELFELMDKTAGNFKLFNGGTDLMVAVNIHKIIPKCFIDISQVKELNFICQENGKIVVGGTVTLSQLLQNLLVQQKLPTLHYAITRMSSTQIRNIATLSGNVVNASPIGDSACVLMGLNAILVLTSKQGERRIAMEDFYRDYKVTALNSSTEIISKIEIPSEMGYCRFEKTSKRSEVDVSTVSSTVCIKNDNNGIVTNCRIAFGGVAKFPVLAKKSCVFLTNKKITPEVIAQVAQLAVTEFNAISDVRGSAEYRKQLIYNHIVKQLIGIFGLAQIDPSSLEFSRGGEERATGVYGVIHDCRERRSQQSGKPKCEGYIPYHLSGETIVKGQAKFIGDEIKSCNMLCVKLLPSPHAHAKILKIDTTKASNVAGVHAIFTWRDILGENQIGHTIKDEPLLPQDEVMYVGQPVAIIAAKDEKIAELARSLIEVDYEILPAILNIEEALKVQSFYVPGSKMERGDVDAGFKASEHILEGEVNTGVQEHLYLETQRCWAIPGDDNNITIYSSTQSTAEMQEIVARILGIQSKDVVVDVRRLGGGFGGKERSATLWGCLAAMTAYKTKCPVELKLTRPEDMAWTGKRHPFYAKYKIGFDKQGKILAYEVHFASNGGAFVDLSLPILERAMFHADNAYYLPNAKITGVACRTNLPPNTAFRGFGAPQGIFTIESALEKVAENLNLDPVAVREVNLYQENQLTHYGQSVHEPCHPELFAKLKEKSHYQQLLADTAKFNRENKYIKRGVGVIPVKFGISFTFTPLNQGTALVWIYADGTIALSHGGIEMGQEINTKVAQVVADGLGIKIGRIRVESSNTLRNGNASPTAASSGADINCNAALDAALQLKTRLCDAAIKLFAEKTGLTVGVADLVFENDRIYPAKQPSASLDFAELVNYAYFQRINLGAQGFYKTPGIHFDRATMQGSPFYYYVFGAALVQVEVDVLTGVSKLLKVYIVHETARSVNLAVDIGQIAGAFFQGFGYSTMEEMRFNERGCYLANTLATYKIPVITNLPEVFEIETCERDRKYTSVNGSKAIGEPPLIYGEAAYFAIKHALSALNLHDNPNSKVSVELGMPATPEAVLKAISSFVGVE